MKCRACGRPIDNNSRFCTYCDCDNYPEMNNVKTKDSPNAYSSKTTAANRNTASKTYQSAYSKTHSNAPVNNKSFQKKNTSGPFGCVITAITIVLIIFFLLSFIFS